MLCPLCPTRGSCATPPRPPATFGCRGRGPVRICTRYSLRIVPIDARLAPCYTLPMDEIWKQHPKYWRYEISNLGRVKREGLDLKLRRVYKNKPKNRYYLGFDVSVGHKITGAGKRGNKHVTIFIHHAVAELFIGPRPFGLYVIHVDSNVENNEWPNLVYGTQGENQTIFRGD